MGGVGAKLTARFMKYFRLLVVFIVLLGGVFILWRFSAPSPMEEPVKPAAIPPPAPAPAVAPPVVVTAPTPPADLPIPNPQPQTDLSDCIDQTIKLLEDGDVLGLVKTMIPPASIQKMISVGVATSVEDIAAQYSARPDVRQMMRQLVQVLESIKGQTPVLDADGASATFKIDPSLGYNGPGSSIYQGPGGPHENLTFTKVDGHWYL
jgi:hypothetical protein